MKRMLAMLLCALLALALLPAVPAAAADVPAWLEGLPDGAQSLCEELYQDYGCVLHAGGNVRASELESGGAYTFTMPAEDVTVTAVLEPAGPAPIPGDVDCNGVVDMSDVSMLFSYLNGMTQLAPEGQANADVNGDGMISIMDISAIYGIIANS